MARYIDADALYDDIEKDFDGCCVYDVSPSEAVSDFQNIVDRQPTVFDMENVVEDITRIGKAYCDSVKCSEECTSCCDHYSIMKAIIDAVRRGGVE